MFPRFCVVHVSDMIVTSFCWHSSFNSDNFFTLVCIQVVKSTISCICSLSVIWNSFKKNNLYCIFLASLNSGRTPWQLLGCDKYLSFVSNLKISPVIKLHFLWSKYFRVYWDGRVMNSLALSQEIENAKVM